MELGGLDKDVNNPATWDFNQYSEEEGSSPFVVFVHPIN